MGTSGVFTDWLVLIGAFLNFISDGLIAPEVE
jgi:hypothetical protein